MTEVPLAWVVFAMQVSIFLLFLTCVYRLSKGIRWSYLMTAVLLSPATLTFTVMDPYASGLRKEILLFAASAFALCVLLSSRLKDWQLSAMLSLMLVGLALSHEALMIGVPPFLCGCSDPDKQPSEGFENLCGAAGSGRSGISGGFAPPRRFSCGADDLQFSGRDAGTVCQTWDAFAEQRYLQWSYPIPAAEPLPGAHDDCAHDSTVGPGSAFLPAGDSHFCAADWAVSAVLSTRKVAL